MRDEKGGATPRELSDTSSHHRCMDSWSQDAVGVYRELWASLKSRQVRGHGAVVTK
jgi:hypothetical protein